MISRRKFIRWLPDEASEPTSTIVLTSPQDRFVDLRIISASELDWAIAGTASSTTTEDGTRRSKWEHWIDSKVQDPRGVVDEGFMFPHAEGTLEKGRMVNPATGLEADYEELWDDQPAKGCTVLMVNSDNVKGMMVKIGGVCQGLMRVGEDVALERWQLKDKEDDTDDKWERTIRMGDGELPEVEDVQGNVGDVVVVGRCEWRVVEA